MIPFFILALGLGVALATYETSDRVRARADDYVRAIRGAHAAHHAADSHLSDSNVAAVVAAQHSQAVTALHAAQGSPVLPAHPLAPPLPPHPLAPPLPTPAHDLSNAHAEAYQVATDVGVDRAVASMEANQAAAQHTADAAKSAKTPDEQIAVAQSASKVLEREKRIVTALADFGVGQCGIHTYAHVTDHVKDLLLTKLHGEGMTVTGDNPWNIETHQYDVKLRAIWDSNGQVLKLIVTAGKGGYAGLVNCDQIWGKIDPIVKGVIGT